jgi:TP901 family phage tail tape measure protein
VAAQDLAEALFDVVSAGVEVGDSLRFLEESAKLAVAGVTDTKTAVDGLTSVINAYGIAASDVGKIADKFFAAQQAGKTTIEELSNAIGSVAPTAKAAGISVDELFGSISALTKQGIKTDEAVTQVKASITSILKPTKEATELWAELRKNNDQVTIGFDALSLRANGLAGFLKQVEEATGGNIDKIAKLFPNVRALNGVLALSTKNFQDLDEISRDVAGAMGLVTEAADKQINTLGGQFTLLSSNIKKAFFDAFGEGTGANKIMTDGLKSINDNFNGFIRAIKGVLLTIETELRVAAALFIRILSKPFELDTYKTILKELAGGIKATFKGIASGVTSIFKQGQKLAKKDLAENITIQEKIANIRAEGAAKIQAVNRQFFDSLNADRQRDIEAEEQANQQRISNAQAAIERLNEQKAAEIQGIQEVVAARDKAQARDAERVEFTKEQNIERLEANLEFLTQLLEQEAQFSESRQFLEQQIADTRDRLREERVAKQKQTTAAVSDLATGLGTALVDNDKNIGQVLGDNIKNFINSQIDAFVAAEIVKAQAGAPLSFGATLAAIGPIIAAGAAGKALVNAIQFHEGGVVGQGSGAETNFNRRLRVNEKRAILEDGERVLTRATDAELMGVLTKINATLNKGSAARQTISINVSDREIARASAKFQPTFQKLNRAGSL